MKFILLAAAAILATPALAQTSPSSTTTTPGTSSTTADTSMQQTTPPATTPTDTMQSTPADPAQPAGQPMSNGPMRTDPATTSQNGMPMSQSTGGSMAADGTDPVGGYAPSGTGISGTRQPGAAVTFQPSQTPDQAFPAPAPLASYPICKAGQFDNCMQASDARRRPAARRRR